jgi:hypothetical protein
VEPSSVVLVIDWVIRRRVKVACGRFRIGLVVIRVSTPDNFPRAETDLSFGTTVKDGSVGKFLHRREPAAIDHQPIVRLNRDTPYSRAVVGLDARPVTVTVFEAGKRFMSTPVIDEDQYTPEVELPTKEPHFRQGEDRGRYMLIAVRTLVDPASESCLDGAD